MNESLKIVLIGLLTLVGVGCASVPKPLQGEPSEFLPLMANQVTPQSVGSLVRWGGVIVSTDPKVDATCMEILARELDRNLRPIVRSDIHFGRFMACGQGFRDPAIYTQGREVSLIGRLDGFIEAPIGEFMYRYPTVSVSQLYLWPERMERDDFPPQMTLYYHGWWGGYPYPIRRVYVPVKPRPPKDDN